MSALPISQRLTDAEELDRTRLEQQVEQGFYLTGTALRELRDRKLWRGTHGSFESYCLDRFGFVRRQAERLIAAAATYENLRPNWSQILPTAESQVRQITSREPEEQRLIWDKAVDRAGGKVPSGRIVGEIAKSIPVTLPFSPVGKNAVVLDKSNPYYGKTVEIVDGFPFEGNDMMVFFRGHGAGADMPCRLSLMQIVEDDQVLDAAIVADAVLPPVVKPKAADLKEQVLWLKQVLREVIECARSSIPEPLLSTALSLLEE